MIYQIAYQSENEMMGTFLQIRPQMNPQRDILQVIYYGYVDNNNEEITRKIYTKILKLDGEYRQLENAWNSPKIQVELRKCKQVIC